MSKLDELLRELCPNGVEYKKLGEIATVLRGASPRPIKKYITNDSDGVNWIKIGDVPVGSKYITQSEEKITKEGAEKSRYVRKGDFILSNSMSFGRPYILAIDGCIHDGWLSISNFKDVFLSDYLYYLLSSSAIQQEMKKRASFGGAVQNLNADIVKALVLPIPPLDVQREIVRMLDSYTESVVELQRQLTAELTARKTQYAYYRDKLLQYRTSIHEYEIGEVCDVSAGGDVPKEHFSKEKSNQYKVPVISNGCGLNALYGYTDIARVDKPAVTVAARGTIGYAEYRDYPYFPIIRLITLIPKDDKQLNAKYLYYSLEERHYKVPTSGILQLTVPVMKKEKVAIPSLDVQNRIVNVLDNFEKICSDLNIGLPAEIEARQKQYEYYRDELLSFKEHKNELSD